MGAVWKAELVIPGAHFDVFASVLEPLTTAVGRFDAEPASAHATARLVAYGSDTAAFANLGRAIAEAACIAGAAVPPYDLVWLPDIDWVALNRASFAPMRVDKLFVHSTTYAGPIPAGMVPLIIDAATAFGTGAHPTTRGCMAALQELGRSLRPGPILDLGCGTGILAIAAAKLLRRQVLAADLDPEATRVARYNARRNGCGPLIRTLSGDGLRTGAVARAGPFALAMANILAVPLMHMAVGLVATLTPGGRLVLSGLLEAQERMVLNPYQRLGCTLRSRVVIDGWKTLVLERRHGGGSREETNRRPRSQAPAKIATAQHHA